jgi:hypothetical protein
VAINYTVLTSLNSVINKATSVLDHFAVELDGRDLYAMLCGIDRDMLTAFSNAARYMKPDNYHDVITIPVRMTDRPYIMDVPFTISLDNSPEYPCYLMPRNYAILTPESKLYDKLLPGILLAQEWRITKDLFEVFARILTLDQLAFVLPWLKELARDCFQALETDADRFCKKNGLGYVTPAKLHALKYGYERLSNPGRATNTPALAPRINQATRLGDKLFAQWRMLKHKEARTPTGSFVAVALSDKMLPDWYAADMTAVLNNWEEKEQERKEERAREHERKMTNTWRKLTR